MAQTYVIVGKNSAQILCYIQIIYGHLLPANVKYNLAIVVLVFRELVVLNTENNLYGIQKHIFYMKTVIIHYINSFTEH